MEASLQELYQKIDHLSAQVNYLSEQAQIAERQRCDRAELVRDITPLANEAFTLAIEQLEEVQENFDLNDLLRLFKRLLRNGRNLEKMLDQLESLAGLLETVGPLANDAFGKVVDVTADMEAKGYFTFTKGGIKLMDSLVAGFNEDDLNHLSENMEPILNIVKQVIKPEVLNLADHTLNEVRQVVNIPAEASYRGLLRQMRNPDVRRGLVITLRILQVIGAQAATMNNSIS